MALVFLGVPGWAGELAVKFLNVGQADAILITCPHGTHRLLIDSGDKQYPKSQENFRAAMTNEVGPGGAKLTVAVASHPHRDHIAGMEWVLMNYAVGTYVDNGQKTDGDMFGTLDKTRSRLQNSGKLKYVNGKKEAFSTVKFCSEVKMKVFAPWAVAPLSGPNNCSVAVHLQHGSNTFLFVGDMEKQAEAVMLNKFTPEQSKLLDVDVLKVGHHSAETSSTAEFVNRVSPDIAVISCGKPGVGTNGGKKAYNHPRLSTVRVFADWFKIHPPAIIAPQDEVAAHDGEAWKQEERPAGIWITPSDGTVTIRSDGKKLKVETEIE